MPPPIAFAERLNCRFEAGTLAAIRATKRPGEGDAAYVRRVLRAALNRAADRRLIERAAAGKGR